MHKKAITTKKYLLLKFELMKSRKLLFVMTKGKVIAALLSHPALLKKATLVHTEAKVPIFFRLTFNYTPKVCIIRTQMKIKIDFRFDV